MTWPGLLGAFCGALVGAGIPAIVSLRTLRQSGRSEWRERLTVAIGLLQSQSAAQRRIGEDFLADLGNSDLGSAEDRMLARRILEQRVGDIANSLPEEGIVRVDSHDEFEQTGVDVAEDSP